MSNVPVNTTVTGVFVAIERTGNPQTKMVSGAAVFTCEGLDTFQNPASEEPTNGRALVSISNTQAGIWDQGYVKKIYPNKPIYSVVFPKVPLNASYEPVGVCSVDCTFTVDSGIFTPSHTVQVPVLLFDPGPGGSIQTLLQLLGLNAG